jgi:threonine/homoserine/homoserine lactone efflux protein
MYAVPFYPRAGRLYATLVSVQLHRPEELVSFASLAPLPRCQIRVSFPTMGLALLLRGFVIGISIAAPVGPIGVLCIRRTLAQGRLTGFLSGLGAATADALYGAVAGFGLTVVSAFLVNQRDWLRLLGGLFLCYLGVRTFLTRPPVDEPTAGGSAATGYVAAYLSTLLLTLTNPVTILSFAAIFAGLGLADTAGDPGSAAGLVLGVFGGSATWWLLLSGGVGLARDRFTPAAMIWVNRLSAGIIITFGLVALGSLIAN